MEVYHPSQLSWRPLMQLHLHSFYMNTCDFNYKGCQSTSAEAKADALSTLKGFKTLRRLHIDIDEVGLVTEDMTFIGHLAELQQLKRLSLWHCNLVGQQVLLCVPLTFLRMVNVMLPLDLRLHSNALETISLVETIGPRLSSLPLELDPRKC